MSLSAINSACSRISKHPHVDAIEQIKNNSDRFHSIAASIRTNLPTKWRVEGKSPTGVQLIEKVIFRFPSNYPSNPPRVYLRADFNRSLPHIQPGNSKYRVEPCYIDGNPRELLHRGGIDVIVNQIVSWLEHAAKDELINHEQGWEPIRRDTIDDFAVVDLSYLQQLVGKRSKSLSLRVKYVNFIPKNKAQSPKKGYYFSGSVKLERVEINRKSLDTFPKPINSSECFQEGEFVAIIATPGSRPSGEPIICDQYLPDTVTNLKKLLKRAYEYGCGKELENSISLLRKYTYKRRRFDSRIPVLIIVCSRRPTHLIGSNSDTEFIPYMFDMPLSKLSNNYAVVPVYPVAVRNAISKQLFQNMSGINVPNDRFLVQLGCGSLGSKITLHMARAGLAPSIVVDYKVMSPHNFARHALAPQSQTIPKAEALANIISELGQSAKAEIIDAVTLGLDKRRTHKILPKKTWLVVNSTASLAVRNTLAMLRTDTMGTRVLETSLFADGTVGLMTIEGPDRNPNSSDLILDTYEIIRSDDTLHESFFAKNGDLVRQEIGQGCSSTTMILPDADISLFSASMARKLLELHKQGLPATGQVLIGRHDDNGLGLIWTTKNVTQFHFIQTDNDQTWQIRISPRAHKMITEECERHQEVETGGIIMGSTCEIKKTITITNVLPAPDDSHRSPGMFVLGTQGVHHRTSNYAEMTGFALHCVGTWHSHLQETGASDCDYQTAKMMAKSTALPVVLLIKTPTRYRAIIEKFV